MEQQQLLNNVVGEQLSTLIEQLHGKALPFILIMPPTDTDYEAQLVTNVDDVEFIQKTLRYLDESLCQVKKLANANTTAQ